MNEPKKISFGFSKLVKKPAVVFKKPPEEKKIELIDCLEGQSIKIKDAVEEVYTPLIIPIKDSHKNLLDRIKYARAKQSESLKKEEKKEVIDERPDSELTIDELAARELLKDAKHRLEQSVHSTSKVFILPAVEDKLELQGEVEPTLEDYENIPINDFGLAMLRGMGWKEGSGIGKNPAKNALLGAPELRPKGLGLGATKNIQAEKPKTAVDKEGKELILIKGAFAKIIAGSNKGNYCEVQGLDDEAGRVIVKTSLKKEILNVNEFLLVPVSKEEYAKGSKVINNAKYEEYKEIMDRKLEQQKQQIKNERDDSDDSDENKQDKPRSTCSKEDKKKRIKEEYDSHDYKKYESDSDEETYSKRDKKYLKKEYDSDNSRRKKDKSSSKYKDSYPSSSANHSDSKKQDKRHCSIRDSYEHKRTLHRRSRSMSPTNRRIQKQKEYRSSSSSSDDRSRRKETSKSNRKLNSSDEDRGKKGKSYRSRSRSYDRKQKKSKHKKKTSSSTDSSDSDRKKKKKHKSKSKHRRDSSDSDRDHRKDRKSRR